jgi:hypothetical protein
MNDEDALKFLIKCLREPTRRNYANYGYDVYISSIIRAYLRVTGSKVQGPDVEREFHTTGKELSPHFYAAAWELARRGILRPGVRIMGAQSTDEGSAGNGFSVTPFGQRWLPENSLDDFIPTEPERFAAMLEPYRLRFGPGFYERAQEAVRCYGAHAYLACCTMSGAAAESILLAAAVAREGSEESVLKVYASANGRSRVESTLMGQVRDQLRREFQGLTVLLKYWRDEAAHGKASLIADNEAYTSLAMLLRFAKLVTDNWPDLTGRPTQSGSASDG